MDEDADDTMSTTKLITSSEGSVRRCLFERPDDDVTDHELQRIWTELRHGSTDVWSFDFDRQRPVAGPIVWTYDGGVWLGRMSADSETTQCENNSSSVTSTHREHTRRQSANHTARVMKSSRLTQRRRQSRVTG